jgi:hypothetical protein
MAVTNSTIQFKREITETNEHIAIVILNNLSKPISGWSDDVRRRPNSSCWCNKQATETVTSL